MSLKAMSTIKFKPCGKPYMTKVVLVAGGQLEELPSDADVWIGVDRGSLYLIEQGITPDLAVGDFDSVSQQEFELIQKQL